MMNKNTLLPKEQIMFFMMYSYVELIYYFSRINTEEISPFPMCTVHIVKNADDEG